MAPRPVVGFRSWSASLTGELYPILGPGAPGPGNPPRSYLAWNDDPAWSACPDGHEQPTEDCACGLWAKARIQPEGGGLVCGAIVGWGRIVLHENGFRAEYARPVALLDDDDYPDGFDPAGHRREFIAAVAERRRLPVLPADELASYAGWFGDLLVHPLLTDYYREQRRHALSPEG